MVSIYIYNLFTFEKNNIFSYLFISTNFLCGFYFKYIHIVCNSDFMVYYFILHTYNYPLIKIICVRHASAANILH